MNDINQLDLMFDALTEIVREEKEKQTPPLPAPAPELPSLSIVLTRMPPLPANALFLGMASDGLPVLLDLCDPVPGPVLIAGDSSSGKTRLLQTIARAAELLHSPDSVQYGVVTTNPDEWKGLYGSESNAGIYLMNEKNTGELLQSLVTWAHNNRGEGQSILLLIEGLDAAANLDEPTRQNLRWLLLRGTSRRVWTFVTLDASRSEAQKEWLGFFRTRLFSRIEDSERAALLTGGSSLDHLSAGGEFAMREGDQLLKFWLPTIE